jgi:tungstate transport system substrate-binding protein
LWDDAGINPKGKGWYVETGGKMGDTLLMASQKKAYTLTDIGTFLNYQKKIDLKVLFQGDAILRNSYSVIAVNPDRFPKVRYREAMDFIAYVTSAEGQSVIAKYVKHGTRLFNPDAIPSVAKKK